MVLPHSPFCHLRAISVTKVIVLKYMSHHFTLQPRDTWLVSESSDKAQKLSNSFTPAVYFCLVLNHVRALTPRPSPVPILLLQILSLTFLLSNLILAWIPGTSSTVQWLRLYLSMQGLQVWSLVGELRLHIPQANKSKQKQYCNRFNKDLKKKHKWSRASLVAQW